MTQGDLAKATELYQMAQRLRPEDYQAPLLMAMLYTGMSRRAEAEASYRRGLQLAERHLQLHPDDARALYLDGGTGHTLGYVSDSRRHPPMARGYLCFGSSSGAATLRSGKEWTISP